MSSEFLEWARGSLIPLATVEPEAIADDLAPLGQMIGDAKVVALSEAVHGAAEPLEFRNRLLRYLVQQKGFTAIAIESGLVEGRLIHDYVRGDAGDLDMTVAKGITWNLDDFPQNRALVRWLRERNKEARQERPVNFYGFDAPGFLSGKRAHFGQDVGLQEALRFLSSVDERAAHVFRARFEPFVASMRFHPRRQMDGFRYALLSTTERDSLTAVIADLIIWLERHETKYAHASSSDEYAWAYRAAIGARQMDNYLRQVPVAWQSSMEEPPGPLTAARDLPPFFAVARDVRDRAQADNLEWIIEREQSGKVLIFASRYHLSTALLRVSWSPHQNECEQALAGTYLRRRLGKDLVTIGHLIGSGRISSGGSVQDLGRAPAHSLDGLAGELGVPLFVLDLRNAPNHVADWLSEERQLAAGGAVLKLPVRQAFDVLFYTGTVTPACDHVPSARHG